MIEVDYPEFWAVFMGETPGRYGRWTTPNDKTLVFCRVVFLASGSEILSACHVDAPPSMLSFLFGL